VKREEEEEGEREEVWKRVKKVRKKMRESWQTAKVVFENNIRFGHNLLRTANEAPNYTFFSTLSGPWCRLLVFLGYNL